MSWPDFAYLPLWSYPLPFKFSFPSLGIILSLFSIQTCLVSIFSLASVLSTCLLLTAPALEWIIPALPLKFSSEVIVSGRSSVFLLPWVRCFYPVREREFNMSFHSHSLFPSLFLFPTHWVLVKCQAFPKCFIWSHYNSVFNHIYHIYLILMEVAD